MNQQSQPAGRRERVQPNSDVVIIEYQSRKPHLNAPNAPIVSHFWIIPAHVFQQFIPGDSHKASQSRIGSGTFPDLTFQKSRSRELLCRFAINEKLCVMPTVIDGKRDQDRNKQVRNYDCVTHRPNAAQRWGDGD
jgi:hypothetical protein